MSPVGVTSQCPEMFPTVMTLGLWHGRRRGRTMHSHMRKDSWAPDVTSAEAEKSCGCCSATKSCPSLCDLTDPST